MKLSKGEAAVLAVTAVLLVLMGGYRLGTGRTRPLGETAALPSAEASQSVSAEEQENREKVDINTADVAELTTLPGIGEVRAQAIIDYRQEHGPFRYVEELLQVAGIGESTLEELMELVTAGGT